ncbi:MAG TPA: radical SAM protein [Bryobacteraceae bacterium]|nr:radical SAM protein [Bryobacteraceae bacterium]
MLFPEYAGPRLVGIARLASAAPRLERKRAAEYSQLECRSLLNRCSSPRMPFRWTINPYRGCEFGCRYCYARYTHEFMELRDPEEFERKIFVKHFDKETFLSELSRVPRQEEIAIGTATDPYQPAERRFGVTRAILEVLASERGRRLSLTTKSDLIRRDLDLLAAIRRRNLLCVNITVTTTDETLARLLEPLAPRPALRLAAVEALAEKGIAVGVFPNPILPGLTDSAENLDAVAAAAARAGARWLGGGVVYLKPCAQAVFFPFLQQHFPHLAPRYRRMFSRSAYLRGPYLTVIRRRLAEIRARHGLAAAPAEYVPEAGEADPQGELFDGKGEAATYTLATGHGDCRMMA